MTTISRNAVTIARRALEESDDLYGALLLVADLADRYYQQSSCGFMRDRQPEYRRPQPRTAIPPPDPVLTSGGN
jgi:hypothetical protein